ncbi:MAG: hypothetical protein H0T71_09800 [Acidobacteria bacterium]|nr:hypothetical protein [Acidobacteriota bacterium]
MQRKTMFAWQVVCALAITACSGTPQTTLSPTGVTAELTAVNADGSTVKVGAPRDLGPNNGETVGSLRPTLGFTNPPGRFVTVGFAYDLEIQNANGSVVYERTIGESGSSSTHGLEADLTYSDNFRWRARVRLGSQAGPWSEFATFRTLDRPAPPAPPPPTATATPSGQLPFPVPAACGPGDPGNRFACASAVAGLSAEWASCAAGRGVSCHRFTREVVYALSQSDPEWQLIQAGPGGHGCNCFGCGTSDGSYFREDTAVYGGNRVFDMIVGAGGPSPSVNWSPVPGPRAGDFPVSAQLCQ